METKTKSFLMLILFLIFVSTLYPQEVKIPKPPKPPTPNAPGWNFFSKMSKEQEQKVLHKYSEQLQRSLKELKRLNEKKYYEILRKRQFDNLMIPFPFMDDENKEQIEREKKINELEVITETLGAKYQSSDKTEKQTIRNELRRKLSELFELKEVNRKKEVEKLKQKLKKLEKALTVRMKNKDEIIKRRLEELIGEEDYLDW